jgi:HEAT repeat protein
MASPTLTSGPATGSTGWVTPGSLDKREDRMNRLMVVCLGLVLAGCSPRATEPVPEARPLPVQDPPRQMEAELTDPRVLGLIAALERGNLLERFQAACELGDIGPEAKAAAPALASLVNDSSYANSTMAARALIRIGPPAVASVVPLLQDPRAAVRKTAAEILGRIGPEAKEAVPALTRALTDTDRGVRLQATTALGQIDPGNAAVRAAELIAALKDKDPEVRGTAAESLGQLSPAPAGVVDALTAALRDDSFQVRLAAVYALGKLGPAGVPALQGAVQHTDTHIRTTALSRLGDLGDLGDAARPALPTLREALRDADLEVRVAAGEALTKLDPTTPLDDLVAELTKALGGADESQRKQAAEALGRLGPAAKSAVPLLVKLLKSGSPEQRDQAVRALGGLGPAAREAVPALIEALQDRETDRQMAADRAASKLRGLTLDLGLSVRAAAADALGEIGPEAKPAVPALLATLKEVKPNPHGVNKLTDVTLYESAARALQKIDHSAAARDR